MKSIQVSVFYPPKPYSMLYCWKKPVRVFQHRTNNRQHETHRVIINQSFNNLKHPSDSSFGRARLVLSTWVSKHHWYIFYLPQIQCLGLETSLQAVSNWSWWFISTISLHFHSTLTEATFGMLFVSTETSISI